MTYEKKIDPLEGVFSLFSQMASGDMSFGDDAITTEIGPITVDSVCATDTHAWETGILLTEDGDWTIVEQYPNRDDAVKGHEKWVQAMKDDPTQELPDAKIWTVM